MIKIVENPIDPTTVSDLTCSTFYGSVVSNYAVVKQHAGTGKSTSTINYRTQGDATQELESISEELKRRWNLEDVLLIRRTGCLAVGEIISLVAASSPNSEDAFEACKYGENLLKKMATTCKSENYLNLK